MHTVLSIQSFVSYGHAGNASATFPLQRLGVTVMPVHTVLFSNHTGYATWRGPLIPAGDVADVITGIDERGALATTDAVLTGYLGAPDMGQVILDAVNLTKRRNPDAVFLADPVMGDRGTGLYCQAGIPEFFRDHLVPLADIMTPNLFELEQLTGHPLHRLDEVVLAAETLRRRGPGIVLVTSVVVDDLPDGLLRMLAVTGAGSLVLIANKDAVADVVRATRNIPDAKILDANYLNIRDLLRFDKVVLPLAAIETISSYLG